MGLKILILSRSTNLYSTNSLLQACRRKGHYARVVDHMMCDLVVDKTGSKIFYEGEELERFDAVIPRIGGSATSYGAAVIRQLESMGVSTTLLANSLLNARDKLSCLQILTANNIGVPKSIVSNNYYSMSNMILEIGKLPIVIKMLKGTHGLGVILSETHRNASSILEAFYKSKQKVMLQEFIEESAGTDVRVFVVDGEIVGVMKRQAKEGEFRSNLHRGASSFVIELTDAEKSAALNAAEAMNLTVAGVDMLQSKDGPLILEVNASPGLEGIETTTGKDIAGKIVMYLERNVKKQ